MESARFESQKLVLDADSGDLIRDMRGIFPVMTDGRLWNFLGGCAMRKRDRSKRWIAHRREVGLENRVLAEGPRVMHAQSHEKIVRVLAVFDGNAISRFARLEQQRVSPVCNRGGLEAEHSFDEKRAAANRMFRRSHENVSGVKLVAAARAGLLRVGNECVAHDVEAPPAAREHAHW